MKRRVLHPILPLAMTMVKGAFAGLPNVKTLVVQSKKLKKSSVKKALKGSQISTIKVQVGNKKTNKKYVKKYKKIFTEKNAGRKAKVTHMVLGSLSSV